MFTWRLGIEGASQIRLFSSITGLNMGTIILTIVKYSFQAAAVILPTNSAIYAKTKSGIGVR
jgi:hypothetical protein